jgi:putative SOS response-associated peptidase YedK
MCYHYSPAKLRILKKRYPEKYKDTEMPAYAIGFAHPTLPVITAQEATRMKWGLIPHWTQDTDSAKKLGKMCLNAQAETLSEKPSFRDALKKKQRCIIPASCFYEWRWEDEKGKEKTKYAIDLGPEDLFYFGGLYSEWLNKATAEVITTYTIITCAANEVMEYIHNKKKRMPTILRDNDEAQAWLSGSINVQDLQQISQAQELDGVPLL